MRNTAPIFLDLGANWAERSQCDRFPTMLAVIYKIGVSVKTWPRGRPASRFQYERSMISRLQFL